MSNPESDTKVEIQEDAGSAGKTSYATYNESKGGSTHKDKSQSVSFETAATLSLQADLPIEQREDDHYVFRRGSTEVHIETYAEKTADDVKCGGNDEPFGGALKLFSTLEALLIFLITVVIKLSAVISPLITKVTELEYLLAMYSICVVWLFYYNLKGTCSKRNQIKFAKSHQSSNRWLKGVVVLFGMAIVVKDGLEFLAGLVVVSPDCLSAQVGVAESFFHALFILCEVKYLFRFSKVYIRNCSVGSRLGLMLIIGANLSTWIASIIDETVIALEGHDDEAPTAEVATSHSPPVSSAVANQSKTHGLSLYSSDPCECHTNFCDAVHVAEKFLFPFQIEFSLVASCLLTITWSNIGKTPEPCDCVVKPSYKFYQNYMGVFFGFFVVFVTLVVLIILGTTEPVSHAESYYKQTTQLVIFNAYWVGVELTMIIACGIGFYLFYRIRRPAEKASQLDNILLLICVIGPLSISLFSLLAILAGPDSRVDGWILSVVAPLCDILQCILQLVFVLFGLQRAPVTSANAKETAESLRQGIENQFLSRPNFKLETDKHATSNSGIDNKTFLRSRRHSITSLVSAIANPNKSANQMQNNHNDLLPPSEYPGNQKAPVQNGVKGVIGSQNLPEIVVSSDEVIESTDFTERKPNGVSSVKAPSMSDIQEMEMPSHHIVKIVSETRVARPDRLRFYLRDIMMFMLISNACLWMFMSLEGVAFNVHAYQSIFFGDSAWTTIHMICRPLNIFFRMHSAGCLFEMWSFA